MRMLTVRRFHDYIAIPLHAVTICLACLPAVRPRFLYSARRATAALLVAQEAIALTAHILYAALYTDAAKRVLPRHGGLSSRINTLKWAEYAASATVGTIATALIDQSSPGRAWITFLAIAGASQQFVGYSIDQETIDKNTKGKIWVNFTIGVLLQVGCCARACRPPRQATRRLYASP